MQLRLLVTPQPIAWWFGSHVITTIFMQLLLPLLLLVCDVCKMAIKVKLLTVTISVRLELWLGPVLPIIF